MLNSDFEEFIICPSSISTDFDFQIENCLFWYAPTTGTPDFFNTCSIGNPNIYTNVHVPSNFIGYQNAKTGNGYLGFYSYVNWINGKEYIQTKLNNVLIKGKVYSLDFYVSLADSSQFAVNQIGAVFTEEKISRMDYYPFDLKPDISSPSNQFIDDTSSWYRISGSFIADGNESYLTIGNFQDSANIEVKLVNQNTQSTGFGASYYYLDNVNLIETPGQITTTNIFTPNNDGLNDFFLPVTNIDSKWTCFILNRWGNLILKLDNQNNFWDGKIDNDYVNDGVYFYFIQIEDLGIEYNGFFNVIK